MVCFNPLQAFSCGKSAATGKNLIRFSRPNSERFVKGESLFVNDSVDANGVFESHDNLQIPCGKCMGCRLERSRQWAVRCMHEASLHDDNCFVTLTFDDKYLKEMCPDGSVNRKHVQDFMKRLRKKFSDRKIRVFYCGEYGDKFERPHYHLCLFNFDFTDRVFYKRQGEFTLFNSFDLSSLWPFGHSVVGSLTFESAAYVARYCTKKISGEAAKDHYKGRTPEFGGMSLKPGIGRDWFYKYFPDVFPSDEVIVRGMKTRPPRYYDRLLEKDDPLLFESIKDIREARGEAKADDNTFARLKVKFKCRKARFDKLIRNLEVL